MHTSVQGAYTIQARTQTEASFWGNDPMNYHNKSYGPYLQQSNNDGHSADSNNDKTFSIDTQQDNADTGVDNPIVPGLENQAETKTWTCPIVSLIADQK